MNRLKPVYRWAAISDKCGHLGATLVDYREPGKEPEVVQTGAGDFYHRRKDAAELAKRAVAQGWKQVRVIKVQISEVAK